MISNFNIDHANGREFELPYRLIDQGVRQFRNGDVKNSLQLFDEAIELKPSVKPYLWQRGISLYYENRFKECSQQFHDDLLVNPADTEEIIWGALCDSGRGLNNNGHDDDNTGIDRIEFSSLDRRPVMKLVYNVFKGTQDVQALLSLPITLASDYFYSQLYTGLYYEYKGDPSEQSMLHINLAADSSYCKGSNDYMCSVASNHRKLRSAAAVVDGQ